MTLFLVAHLQKNLRITNRAINIITAKNAEQIVQPDPRERSFFQVYPNIVLRSKLVAKFVGGLVNSAVRRGYRKLS